MVPYADDTDLYACDTNLETLLYRLEHDAHIAIEWFESNYMKLNEDKCHFLISGNKSEHLFVNVGPYKIWESNAVKILGITVDANLKFNIHSETILNIAGKKLTILARMANILSFAKMRLLIKSFFESQFAYCPLVWMLYNRSLNNRINKLHERALRILYKDDISTFEQLLTKDESVTMHDRNMQRLAIEMYKAKNDILPCPIAEFVTKRSMHYNIRQESDFERKLHNKVLCGSETLRIRGPKIWDLVPNDIKLAASLSVFKSRIKKWSISCCPCRLCKDYIFIHSFIYSSKRLTLYLGMAYKFTRMQTGDIKNRIKIYTLKELILAGASCSDVENWTNMWVKLRSMGKNQNSLKLILTKTNS